MNTHKHTFRYLKSAREDREHIHPPLGLLLAGGFDERHTVGGSDSQGELVAGDFLGTTNLQHPVHIHHSLGDGGRLCWGRRWGDG